MKLGIGAVVLAGAASIGLGGFAGLAWIAPVPAEAAPAAREAKTGKAILAEQRRARGAYLARAANCMGCHTAQGGRAYAGGRSLSTPFGTFITPNITPDKATGIGQWNEDHETTKNTESTKKIGDQKLSALLPFCVLCVLCGCSSSGSRASIRALV